MLIHFQGNYNFYFKNAEIVFKQEIIHLCLNTLKILSIVINLHQAFLFTSVTNDTYSENTVCILFL